MQLLLYLQYGLCLSQGAIAKSYASQDTHKEYDTIAIFGTYKDDGSKYPLRNLLRRQETEASNKE